MLRHPVSGLAYLIVLIACFINPVAASSFDGRLILAQQQTDGTYSVPKKKPEQPPQQQPEPQPQQQAPVSQQAQPPQQVPVSQQAQPPQQVQPGQAAQPTPAQPASATQPTQAPGSITERVLRHKFGSEGFQNLLNQAENMKRQPCDGTGAACANTWFDGAGRRVGTEPNVAPAGTPVFQGRPQGAPVQAQPSGGALRLPAGVQLQQSPPVRIQRVEPPSPVINGGYKPATTQDIKGVKERYGGVPGGVVIEGAATGLGRVDRVAYDPKFNALALDDRSVYFVKVPPRTLAVMCRAIAQDDRVGVSLGRKHIVYGALPPESELAMDLKLADHFLGDIVFAEGDWTIGYRFANGFRPQPNEGNRFHVAVFFNFNGFQFRVEQEEVRLTAADFDVRLVPLTEQSGPDGAHQPDVNAIAQGHVSRQYEANARHVAENIGYYRRERIVSRVFEYGEIAAFVRGLKQAGIDLRALAQSIDASIGR